MSVTFTFFLSNRTRALRASSDFRTGAGGQGPRVPGGPFIITVDWPRQTLWACGRQFPSPERLPVSVLGAKKGNFTGSFRLASRSSREVSPIVPTSPLCHGSGFVWTVWWVDTEVTSPSLHYVYVSSILADG